MSLCFMMLKDTVFVVRNILKAVKCEDKLVFFFGMRKRAMWY